MPGRAVCSWNPAQEGRVSGMVSFGGQPGLTHKLLSSEKVVVGGWGRWPSANVARLVKLLV